MKKKPFHCYRSVVLLFVASACLLFEGCSGGDKSYVTGTVTYDGQPLPNGSISFISLEKSPGGSATTDEDGYYEAYMSLNNDWLTPGEYQVEILGYADVLASDGMREEIKPGDVSLPKQYRGEQSELRMTVTPGSNTVDFDLTSEPSAPAAKGE